MKLLITIITMFITVLLVAQSENSDLEVSNNSKKISKDSSTSITPQNNDIKQLLVKIKASYDNVKVLEANFEQEFFHKAYKRKKKSSGSVIFTNDLKMKWSYTNPEKKYIISNGNILWIYEPENEQAFKTSIKGSELESAAKFLLGKMDVLKKYNLKLKENTLILTPKQENNYKKIYLKFNSEYRIIETKMIDNFDNENIIKYKEFKVNEFKLSKEFFNFIPPDGIEIIEKDK